MVSDLTVIKHNHSKSKYPTHESGITWQPGSIRQSRHKDAYEKYPGTIRWENPQTDQESKTWGKTAEGNQEDGDENDRECRAG